MTPGRAIEPHRRVCASRHARLVDAALVGVARRAWLLAFGAAVGGCSLIDLSSLDASGGATGSSIGATTAASTGASADPTTATASATTTTSAEATSSSGTGSATTRTLIVPGGRLVSQMPQPTIFVSTIGLDGSLGPFATQAMPFVRQNHGAAVIDGHLLILGGLDEMGDSASLGVAPITSDGAVGAWFVEAAALPMPRGRFGFARRGNDAFVAGGRLNDGSAVYGDVVRANFTGGALTLAPAAMLPAPNADVAAVVLGDRLVVTGGTRDTTGVFAWPIDAQGVLGPELPALPPLGIGRYMHCAVVVSAGGVDRVYVLGGVDDAGAPTGSVESATFDGDVLVGWELYPDVFPPRRAMACASAGGFIYVIGGIGAGDAALPEVFRISIAPMSGAPDTTIFDTALPEARAFMPALVLDG